MAELPTTARAVIIGGGIVGCSTAYHLGKLGWTDTVLLERKKLTSAPPFTRRGWWGSCAPRPTSRSCWAIRWSCTRRLEAETGLQTGWKMNGGLRLACNAERWTEVKRQATTAHTFGLEMHLLTPKEAQDLWPLMTIDDLVGAAYPADRRAGKPVRHHPKPGARARGWRGEDLRGYAGDADHRGRRPDPRAWRRRSARIECEKVVLLRRAMDAHPGGDCRGERAAGVGGAPVHDHREDRRA